MKSELFSVVLVSMLIFCITGPVVNATDTIETPKMSEYNETNFNRTENKTVNINQTVEQNRTFNADKNQSTESIQNFMIYVDPIRGDDSNAGGDQSYPKKTLKSAIKSAKNGNIITIVPNSEICENNLIIDKDLTILGHNSTINGEFKGRVFEIRANNRVELKGMEITRGISGNSTNAGAGVYIGDNCDVLINQCSFISNCKLYSTGPYQYGGAIYKSEGHLKIINSDFSYNEATYGGVIYTTGKTEIENCFFNRNEASSRMIGVANTDAYGGVIYNDQSLYKKHQNSELLINNCQFYKNHNTKPQQYLSTNYGGVIYNNRGLINIKSTKFEENSFEPNYEHNKHGGGYLQL